MDEEAPSPPTNPSLCPFCGWYPCTFNCPCPFDELELSELEAALAANDPKTPDDDDGEEWKDGAPP